MFIVKIHYGLGNQLFQYAFARSLSLKRGIPFSMDLHFYRQHKQNPDHPRVYQLNKFHIQENVISDEQVDQWLNPSTLDRGVIKLENLVRPYYKRRIVYERELVYDANMWEVEDDAYLAGYWQDLRYFQECEADIRNDFTFRDEPDQLNQSWLNRIKAVNSVGIHVRRGDYLTDKFTLEQVGMADMTYYKNAVQFVEQNITEPHYFVFTDDPDWVRKKFDIGVKYELIAHNNQENAYQDLRLLSACNHQVISNSSFGWWGAWLNSNTDKIVVAPRVWRINGPDMYKPATWVVQ
ncbi:MAG TPA: alpha-1,2-fucosyltransferase [Chitinophagaceae bacterium]|nr:alpha-1,2-fucosyltransferase [Chitinophagaceae bacterium]